ncbi:MAG: Rrf2 family transcriptional regulator [Gemmatimonadota bacterium]
MLSQSAEYAIRLAVELARMRDEQLVGANVLARRLTLPPGYCAKILQTLARQGILVSTRGKRGGFRLARSAADIGLSEIVAPFFDLTPGRRCLIGPHACSDKAVCAVHTSWKAVGADLAAFFRNTTLAMLLSGGSVAVPRGGHR